MDEQNQIKIFEFEDQDVETVFLDGEPLFNPYHIGICLEMSESAVQNHLAKMNDSQKIILENSKLQFSEFRKLANRGETFLRESGVYKLIFKSRAPKAEEFQDWITDEVLPVLRKTGSYTLSREEQMLATVIENTEILLGIKKREIAIHQNSSWNMKLFELILDCSRNGMGGVGDLYDELCYLYEAETGFDIEKIARSMGLTRKEYFNRETHRLQNII